MPQSGKAGTKHGLGVAGCVRLLERTTDPPLAGASKEHEAPNFV